MNNDHRGAPQFVFYLLKCCQKGLSTIQWEDSLLIILLHILQLLYPEGDRHHMSHVKPAGIMKTRGFILNEVTNHDVAGAVYCKQISPCSRAWVLKIPQTGYEALC